ncbi:unnamed protein product [Cylindrotheca closterium]|uniref:Uncharacterized protein n=1 Tax=Cylindrotheca closterium TaxID=2856 RepID=A0AAD2G0I6_9STRA|nr:unnamed protein product [Cylindrotheca closterium]
MKYLKHYFAHKQQQQQQQPSYDHHHDPIIERPRRRLATFQTSNTTTNRSRRPSSFEENLAKSCFQTKKMIDGYGSHLDHMKRTRRDRNGGYNVYKTAYNNNNNSKQQQQRQQSRRRDRYDVHTKPEDDDDDDILLNSGDTDSLTSLTDDLTYLQSARREAAHRIRNARNNNNNDDDDNDEATTTTASLLLHSSRGSVTDPVDVTTIMDDDYNHEERTPPTVRQDRRIDQTRNASAGGTSSRNNTSRSGRFNSQNWRDSIRHRRSLLNDDIDIDIDDNDDNGDDGDYRTTAEDWPGARIPLTTPPPPLRRRKQSKRQESQQRPVESSSSSSSSIPTRTQRTIMDQLNDFDHVLGETHRDPPEAEPPTTSSSPLIRHYRSQHRSSHYDHAETETLKRALKDQREKFDQEKGALYIEMERIKRDHGKEVDRLQSDLCHAQLSHQMYLKKLNEVIDYHEVLHEKETVTMNKILEQVKKEKRDEVSKLTRELEEVKSVSRYNIVDDYDKNDDPDIQECIQYLSDESEAQKQRRSQFLDTMVALQSIASRITTKSSKSKSAGFSNRDLQDIDGLLDMLHHVYNVSENSHQKTLCMSHMLIEECSQVSKTAMGFEDMKSRLDSLEEEETVLAASAAEEGGGMEHHHDQLQRHQAGELVCGGSFDELTKSMEISLYRGLGLMG